MVDFPKEVFTIYDDEKMVKNLESKKDFTYFGFAVFGENEATDKYTAGLEVWK